MKTRPEPSINTKRHTIRRKAYVEPSLTKTPLGTNLLVLPAILLGLFLFLPALATLLRTPAAAFWDVLIKGDTWVLLLGYIITVLMVYALIYNIFNFFSKPKSNQVFSMKKALIALSTQTLILCLITLPSITFYMYLKMTDVAMSTIESVVGGGFVLIFLFLIGWCFVKLIQFTRQYFKYGKSTITIKPATLMLGSPMTIDFVNPYLFKDCQEVELIFRNIKEKHEQYIEDEPSTLDAWVLYQYSHTLPLTGKNLSFEIDIPTDAVYPTNYNSPNYWELIIQSKKTGFYSRFMLDVLPYRS